MAAGVDLGQKELVYYDANIWISYMLGHNDNFYSICKPLIEDVEQKRRVAIVSHLTLMESIYAIRKKVAGRSSSIGSGTNTSHRETLARNCVNKFVKLVNMLSIQEKIIIIRPNQSIVSHHSAVLGKLKTIFGQIKLNRYCANCDRRYLVQKCSDNCPACSGPLTSGNRYEYRGLGHADIEHAYFAKYGGASAFYSTDKSFDDLSGDQDFSGLITFVVLGNK